MGFHTLRFLDNRQIFFIRGLTLIMQSPLVATRIGMICECHDSTFHSANKNNNSLYQCIGIESDSHLMDS